MNEILRRLLFLPEQASTFAVEVDHLHYFVIGVTMLVSFLVAGVALFFFWRYHRRAENQATPHIEPTIQLEAAFIVVPLFFFLVWFVIGFKQFSQLSAPPADAMDVYVMGKQWMWKFAYPDGPNSIGVLHVPANRPVRLLITSRDVIHSFFVPSFRLKADAVPGRYNQTWFIATKPGRYQILCAEYCGAQHSKMWGEVEVLAPETFDEWMKEQQRGLSGRQDVLADPELVSVHGNLVEMGKRAAMDNGCFKCHTTNGERHIGPSWLDLYQRKTKLESGETIIADEAYLTESMMDPRAKLVAGYQPVMPSFQGKLRGPDAAAIVEFIKSLRSSHVNVGPTAGPYSYPSRGPSYEPVDSNR